MNNKRRFAMSSIRNLLNEQGAPMSPAIARKALDLLMNAKMEGVEKPGYFFFRLARRYESHSANAKKQFFHISVL